MIDGLKDKYRTAIVDIVSANQRVERAVLFGSRAMGTFTTTSDVDIVLFGENLTMTDQANLAQRIDELSMPQRVDILLLHSIKSEKLLEHIRRHGVELYRRGAGTRSNWPTMTLRDAKIQLLDCVHKTPPAADEGYPYVAIPQMNGGHIDFGTARLIEKRDFIKWTQKAFPQPWDIVLSRRCNPGETAHVPSGVEFALGQNIVLLRSDGKIIFPPFLRWLTRGPMWWAEVQKFLNVGAVFDSLRCADIPLFSLPVPQLPYQRAIAHILGSLDDKIELNRQMNSTLEQMAQAIFKSWFIDFDPVHAKAEGHDTGLPPEIADLFPDSFEDSELGVIPMGWERGTVRDGFNVTMGQSPPGSTYNENGDGLPFFQGRRDFGFRYPSRRVYCTEPKRLANEGDALISVRAPVGDINMAIEHCCIGRGLAAVRHKSGSRSFSYYSMRALTEQFSRFEGEGTVFGSINKKQFEALPHLVCSSGIVEEFEDKVGKMDVMIRNSSQEIATLSRIRDTLLPKLISGELAIPDVDQFLESAENMLESTE